MIHQHAEPNGEVGGRVPAGALIWGTTPIRVALDEAAAQRGDVDVEDHVAFRVCPEVGRRLLLAQFTFNKWVLRRVEKVRFTSDRRVGRRSSIEFEIPNYAPIVADGDGHPRWLVPLTVMRRRTLVNLDIQDEQGASVSMLGLRFTQGLDEGMLCAAARLAHPTAVTHEVVDKFVNRAVSGNWKEVQSARDAYEDWRDRRGPELDETDQSRDYPAWVAETDSSDGRAESGPLSGSREQPADDPGLDVDALEPYFENPTFRATLERLWHNFVLYVTLPVDCGQHRILHLAFEERVLWQYQLPRLERRGRTVEYEPIAERISRFGSFHEFLGWNATRIRFLTPSAENSASYHFEFTAPTGLWIPSAALVAGRPNLDTAEVTPWDSVNSSGHSAGLHVVEVPNGSLCRAQVELRVPSRGWLSTLMVSCWAVFGVLAATTAHARLLGLAGQWTATQVTNIVLLLVTVCVGVSTYVAQHPSGDVAARMLSGLRIVGVIALTLPAFAALSVVFVREKPQRGDLARHPEWMWALLPATETRVLLICWLAALTVLSALAACAVSLAWWRARQAERLVGRASPWDMTAVERRTDESEKPIEGELMSFGDLIEALGLDHPAVGVNSAEGWHERYGWDDDQQRVALKLIRQEMTTKVRARVSNTSHGTDSTECECDAVWVHRTSHA